jgi:hypothetical protein
MKVLLGYAQLSECSSKREQGGFVATLPAFGVEDQGLGEFASLGTEFSSQCAMSENAEALRRARLHSNGDHLDRVGDSRVEQGEEVRGKLSVCNPAQAIEIPKSLSPCSRIEGVVLDTTLRALRLRHLPSDLLALLRAPSQPGG